MGRSEGPGCYCAVNDLLRYGIEVLSSRYRAIVVDGEAHRLEVVFLLGGSSMVSGRAHPVTEVRRSSREVAVPCRVSS
jgi:hypothetical protein